MTGATNARPSSADLSTSLGWVRDQGTRDTCLACAATTVHEQNLQTRGRHDKGLSEEFLHWSSRPQPPRNGTGRSVRQVSRALNQHGQPTYASWPYDPLTDEGSPGYLPPDLTGHQFWTCELQAISGDIASVRDCLLDGDAAVLGIALWPQFYVADRGILEVPTAGSLLPANHAVVAAGFNDSTQTFLICNSWGAGWGDGGRATMPYAAWALVARGVWRLTPH
jgi:hypothetical protein